MGQVLVSSPSACLPLQGQGQSRWGKMPRLASLCWRLVWAMGAAMSGGVAPFEQSHHSIGVACHR